MEPLLVLIERLEALVAEAGHVPLTNRLVLDENRLLDILEELRNAIPPAVQEAQRVSRERERILQKAREEADAMIREARAYGEQLTKESSIAERAASEAQRIENEARAEAREIRASARAYADEVLARVEANLKKAYGIVHEGREQVAAMRDEPEGADEAEAAGPGRGPARRDAPSGNVRKP